MFGVSKLLRISATKNPPGILATIPYRQFSSHERSDHKNRDSSSRIFNGLLIFSSFSLFGFFVTRKRSDGNSFSLKNVFTLNAAERINTGKKIVDQSSPRYKYNFIADVVEKRVSSLVFIEIKDQGSRDFFTGFPMTASNGSGFIVESDGLILTNAHVVTKGPRRTIQVRLQDGRVFPGTVEDVDSRSDLATVRIDCKDLPAMPLGDSTSVRTGEFVIAMGSPLSLSNTITTGVVSSTTRRKEELGLGANRDVPQYIQTDAAITFGNSGGPLINLDGEAIGINSMKVNPGISFAIPINYAKEFLSRSKDGSHKKQRQRRFMGISILSINNQVRDELVHCGELSPEVQHGILVARVVKGSPAAFVGLRVGDVITHINGTPLHGVADFYKFLEDVCDLNMTVNRRGKNFAATIRAAVSESGQSFFVRG